MPKVSLPEYAKMKGVSPEAIYEKISRGVFSSKSVRRKQGRKNFEIDSDIADLELEFSSERLLSLNELDKIDAEAEEEQPNEEREKARAQAIEYREARTSTEELRARKLQLDIEAREKTLLDAEEVRRKITKLVTETKDTILNVPAKIAPLLVSVNNTVEMEELLLRALNEALGNLSRLETI